MLLISLIPIYKWYNGSLFENIPDVNMEWTNEQISERTFEEEHIEYKYKVVIDPGHGGSDPGAIGFSGSYEKDFTLSLSTKVFKLLTEKYQIGATMTREGDQHLSSKTKDRPNIANHLEADLFISIHANIFEDSTVTGTETFYYDEDSKSLADIIHKHVIEATGYHDRGVKVGNFFVLKDTEMPAALLELGYLTNQEQEEDMLSESFQNRVALAIVEGIIEYLEQ
ncbi:hypothetical protein AZF04_08495 [Alkalihalobacillus trypoxylicola]|uniref:MurNAc-LAA domain-containing protein n=1 Tax=Alkalihalobacillus trypoxylicola TaxID=519424 RepID=A0A162DHX5_9BACI|nr:hypothetical protein AZF04_08495 [Alkalihalobacillus trypoxylicola]